MVLEEDAVVFVGAGFGRHVDGGATRKSLIGVEAVGRVFTASMDSAGGM